MADNRPRIAKVKRPTLLAGFENRLADNWRPLFAIADTAGGDWPELACDAAIALSSMPSADGDSYSTMLLADLKQILECIPDEKIGSGWLCEALAALETRLWATISKGKPITQAKLTRMLKPFEIFVSGRSAQSKYNATP